MMPELWGLNRLGNHFSERNEKVSDKDYQPLSVTKLGILPQVEGVAKTDNNDNRKRVVSGDFVINSRSDRKLSSGLSELDGSVSVINTVLRPKGIDPKFAHFLLKNYGFGEEFFRWGHGIVMDLWTTRWSEMKNILLPIPPMNEQKKIADIINNKTEKIDLLVKIQKQQIERLKEYKQSVISNAVTKGLNLNTQMRDSGIDFVGQIPVSWTVKPLKSIFSIKRGSLDKNVEENEISVKLVQYTAIYNNVKLENREPLLNVTATKREIEDASVKHGDLLMTASSETADDIGHTSLIALPDNDLVFGSDIIRLRTNDIDFEYRQFILENKYHLDILTSYCRGITRFRFSMDDFGKHKWIVPPKEEQSLIAKYLNFVTSKVNLLIFQKNLKIEKLNEYKKSLIYEYVTGKREAI